MEASQQTFLTVSEDAPQRGLRPVGERYAAEVLSLDNGSGIRRLALMLDTVLPRLTGSERSDKAGP